MNKIIADIIKIIKSNLAKLFTIISPKSNTGIPKTIAILKILLPIILPTSKSVSRFKAATIDVTNSGSDVPRAIIVKEIILSLTPNFLAIVVAEETTNSLPNIIAPKPIITNKILNFKEYFGFSPSSVVLFLA